MLWGVSKQYLCAILCGLGTTGKLSRVRKQIEAEVRADDHVHTTCNTIFRYVGNFIDWLYYSMMRNV